MKKIIILTFIYLSFCPLLRVELLAQERLNYWRNSETYLQDQASLSFEMAYKLLAAHPPGITVSDERKSALLSLDVLLHDTRLDNGTAFLSYMNQMAANLLLNLQKTQPSGDDVCFFRFYNHGFIVKTASVTIGIDLTRGGNEAKPFISDTLIRSIVEQCDILFITHAHGDHADFSVAKMFCEQGKTVIAPEEIWKDMPPQFHVLRGSEMIREGITFTAKQRSISINVYPGHQGDVLNNVYIIVLPEQKTIVHTGDQDYSDDLVAQISNHTKVDVLLVHCWMKNMEKFVSGIQPSLVISGHENEMGHSIDHREAYWLTFRRMANIKVPYVVMAWGESFVHDSQFSPVPKQESLSDWKNIQTIDDLYRAFPDRLENLLQKLNLDTPGLEAVKKAYEENHIPLAGQLLLDYYQKDGTATWLRVEKPQVSPAQDPAGDLIVQNRYTFYGQEAKIPYTANGHIVWSFRGPSNDVQWARALNRHYHIQTLLNAYQKTGNPLYAQTIDLHIKDWIIANLPYPGKNSGSEMWCGLEVFSRVVTWAKVFYALNNTGYLSPATQLLLLSSLPEHAHYLRNFHWMGNWLTMEMQALATVATAWSELKESSQWFQYAVSTAVKNMEATVYPDGAQKELTSSYHLGATIDFSSLIDICKQSNKTLPESYVKYVENMWNYSACIMCPNGNNLHNNDSNLDYIRERIQTAAEQYRREDWKYIATNGQEGTPPTGGPSFFFPWAGHLITRSGYDAAAQWAFFDTGPWGLGAYHCHNDKLHLSVSAYGHDFLVDAGIFSYDGEIADKFGGEKYAKTSAAHNVIHIDGKGQAPGPECAEEPLGENYFKITDRFDYAWNSFDRFLDVEGHCEHSRTLFYVRGKFWVVVDKIATDRPRKIETLWHWHPECRVSMDAKQVITGRNAGEFLHLIPVGAKWSVSQVKGQETPSLQGWYSRKYNVYEPNTASICTANIQKETAFVWILYPSEKNVPDIKAKVISENKEGVTVQVNHPKEGTWTLNIPFADSSKVLMNKLEK